MKYRIVLLIFFLAHWSLIAYPHWQHWFMNQDQKAHQKLSQGKPKEAAENFRNQNWKAVAYYRAGQYKQAENIFKSRPSIDNLYNLGNAYAQQNQFKKAIQSYEKVLKLDPKHQDAKFNLALLKSLEKKQQNKQDKDKQQNQNNTQNNNQRSDSKQRNKQKETSQNQKDNQKNEPQIGKDNTKQSISALEKSASNQQWLKRVKEEPSDLLKHKFLRDYLKRKQGQSE